MIKKKLKMGLPLITIALLSLLILLFVSNSKLPYEQDQVGKAAQIIHLINTSNEWQPLLASNIYRNFELSNYYLISANLYKLIGGDIFSFMNWQAVVWGVIFFTSITKLINKVSKTPYILTFFIFISMPIVVTTFIYGNEVSVTLSLFVLSLLLAQLSFKGHEFLAILLLCLATYSRVDIILLLPFWFAWNMYYSYQNTIRKDKLVKTTKLLILFVVFCLVYWILFLRELPLNEYNFAYNTNIKLLIGYMTYPFNLGVVLWGSYALMMLIYKNWKEGVIYLFLLIPFFFYLPNLSTPKYIIGFSLMFGIPLALRLAQMSWRMKFIVLMTIGIWWFVSITPYGLFNTREGAYWFLPTDDGPIPTGAYLSFYTNVRNGFYQERYLSEREGVETLFDQLSSQETASPILGDFNPQFYDFEVVTRNLWEDDNKYNYYKWARFGIGADQDDSYMMIDRSYLNLGALQIETQEKVREWLSTGKIEIVVDSEEPFPPILMIGDTLVAGNEIALAERILFMDSYYNGHRVLPSSQFVPAYHSLCWIAMLSNNDASAPKIELPIDLLYQDSDFYALEANEEACFIYNTMMPFAYFGEQDPRR